MNPPDELRSVARRVVWFKPPEETLEDRTFFLAHVMTYGTLDDVLTTQRYVSIADFRAALDHVPAGVFDPRSWAYWNIVFGRLPVPPLPRRQIGGAATSRDR